MRAAAALLALLLPAAAAASPFDHAAPDVAARMLDADPRAATAMLYAWPMLDVQPMLVYAPSRCRRPGGCVIERDMGGWVIQYRMAAEVLLREGGTVRVEGDCASSCTLLVDALAAVGQACIGERGRLSCCHSASWRHPLPA